jgi:hypothetical protein
VGQVFGRVEVRGAQRSGVKVDFAAGKRRENPHPENRRVRHPLLD